jgi:SAM-dependent methyltransferase
VIIFDVPASAGLYDAERESRLGRATNPAARNVVFHKSCNGWLTVEGERIMSLDSVNWHTWLQRWDVQQTGYLPDREARFNVMLDVLEILMPAEFVALDLACGPGAISQRLLGRFPKARSIAVDLDPFLMALGKGVLGDMQGRLRWLEADLNDPTWSQLLGDTPLDAVLSTTALHWLSGDMLARVYRQLGQCLRPGGVFLNGDNMRFAPHLETFHRVTEAHKQQVYATSFAHPQHGTEDWEQWWAAARAEPVFAALIAERERRFAKRQREWINPSLDFQMGALQEAGFREVSTIWQYMNNRVLMAVR